MWKLKESVHSLIHKQEWRHRCREQASNIFALAAVRVRGRTRSEGKGPAPGCCISQPKKGMAVGPWMHVWKPWELNPGSSAGRERRTGLPISRQQRCGTGVSQSCQRKHRSSSETQWGGGFHLALRTCEAESPGCCFPKHTVEWGFWSLVLWPFRPRNAPAGRIPYLIEQDTVHCHRESLSLHAFFSSTKPCC